VRARGRAGADRGGKHHHERADGRDEASSQP
jgi:hypothetical protein